MHLIHSPLPAGTAHTLPEVPVVAERRTLAKRLWRASAADGTEFGFELTGPLRHRDVVHVSSEARYVIRQLPEPVLEVSLAVSPEKAALAGWIAGNMHCPVEVQNGRLLAADEKGLRAVFERAHIPFGSAYEVFQPSAHTASAGHGHAAPHSHGAGHASHSHDAHTAHAHSHSHSHEHGHSHG